ncbi:NADPH-dependent FMN reductase [Leucobacter sp. UT-8R-CII-1-4]|uniref:NADPH-dependent FMN reductase n=1 Tax=Leucobacter sp. UT-8R-CII-1-4 TaxID=3040075 RepID=UPI0024A953C0|nr:NADPH-dependent FMN reductase [Leucobacter sp. UT-8R-CII-1-4]MDI6022888.1 NADPH-dependent FMN reductase [Leucobacter sp. UT-8R-CII-1-4]
MSKPKLMIIVGSIREGRSGLSIAKWAEEVALADGRFDVDFADLKEIALPLMDEPNHPSMQQYTKQHTKDWAARVEATDAFLFVFPEYNHSYSPAIKNALDYLVREWDRKAVGFINWGGNSGGTRAQAALRPVVAMLGMVMTHGQVEINFPWGQIEEGTFVPNDQQTAVLQSQLDELLKIDSAISSLRG